MILYKFLVRCIHTKWAVMKLKTDVYSSSDKCSALLPGCTKCLLRNSTLQSPCTHANQRCIVIPRTWSFKEKKVGCIALSYNTPCLWKNFCSVARKSLSQSLTFICLEKSKTHEHQLVSLMHSSDWNSYSHKYITTQSHLTTEYPVNMPLYKKVSGEGHLWSTSP